MHIHSFRLLKLGLHVSNDCIFALRNLFEHLLHDADIDLKLIRFFLGEFQAGLSVESPIFRADFIDEFLEDGKNLHTFFVYLLDFLDQITIILEVLDLSEKVYLVTLKYLNQINLVIQYLVVGYGRMDLAKSFQLFLELFIYLRK